MKLTKATRKNNMELKKADYRIALSNCEEWRTVKENQLYEVHWRGVVRNRETKKNLKAGLGGNGYFTVSLYSNRKGKTFVVHRLIADAFLPNPLAKEMVNHIDGNKQNNHLSNLEWVTRSENESHAHKLGLKKTPFPPIPVAKLDNDGNVLKVYKSATQAEEDGYSSGNISRCCHGKTNHHKGYKWKFLN